jgi:aminobenzoyl-glutamate transport protein
MKSTKKSVMQRFLDIVEGVGNKLPHPTIMFIWLVLILLACTAILSALGIEVKTPTGTFPINNLIGQGAVEIQNPRTGMVTATFANGWQYLADRLTPNFINFAPFGMVMVIMIAIGVAEHSGLIAAAVRKMVLSTPERLITPVVVLAGLLSNIAADAGYLVLVPLGAIVFYGMGRHPLAGLAAAFAGVSGGFSANLAITTLEPLLGGFTLAAAKTGDAIAGTSFGATMNIATMNYYFIVASTFMIVIIGSFVVDKIVVPHLGEYKPTPEAEIDAHPDALTDDENRALRWAGFTFLAYIILLVITLIPVESNLPLVGSLSTATLSADQFAAIQERFGSVGVTHAPFFSTEIIVTTLFFMFFLPGFVYGIVSRKIKKGADLVFTMEEAMRGMASFIILVFFMAQFVAYFNASNIGVLIAMQGAKLLDLVPHETLAGTIGLVVGFVALSACINLFMGSASAKWAILAPIFVPILMTVGMTPAATQMLYRIGDSCTNIITPLMTFFAFVIVIGRKYQKDFGIGSLVSLMLPFSLIFLISWTLLFLAWGLLGLPLGPDSAVFFTPPGA